MNVRWVLPDRTVLEREEPDVEQLAFLLRLTGRVQLAGSAYRVAGTELVVGETVSLRVTLEKPDEPPFSP
jgi:hypothetical protein